MGNSRNYSSCNTAHIYTGFCEDDIIRSWKIIRVRDTDIKETKNYAVKNHKCSSILLH